MKYYDVNLSTTDIVCEEICIEGGRIDMSGDEDLKFVTVVNRYEDNENITLGLVQATTKRIVPLFTQLCREQ